MSFQFIMPKQIFYGENALSTAAEHICALGKKALVVTVPHDGKARQHRKDYGYT